jgi:glutathione-regulated potassium-efflux system ancillary protein KefG
MKKILILFAHPRPDRSEANLALAKAVKPHDAVTFVDLYAEYPDLDFDVDMEQARLVEHDVIIFQHPVFWYSTPAIIKEWQDLVLEYGFAYGAAGHALDGKIMLNAVTCGAAQETYEPDGAYQNTLRQLFAPFEQTARLCGMRYLPPFALFGSGHAREQGRLEAHAHDYFRLIDALARDEIDLDRTLALQALPERLDGIINTRKESV